ncbi:MAG: glycerol-3-phosphate dehydrogenase/oxidase [Betaproteobacteria bacterium]
MRVQTLARLREPRRWDLVVVGGGATGLGVALDAAVRGLQVLLLEAADFAQGTSSRATKLVHGGVRYLAQGHLSLVREALRERSALLANAPHLARPLAFVVPGYRAWELPFYGAGLKAYEWLAGRRSLGPTQVLSARATRQALPMVRERGLIGGIRYWDGQFDDARLAVALARTAAAHGAVVVNHLRVTGLRQEGAQVRGVRARDVETGEVFDIAAGCVVNATGVWVDGLRREANSRSADEGTCGDTGGDTGQQTGQETGRATGREMGQETAPLVTPSQGVHLVVDRAFLPGSTALMVPRTADGRVLFAVPWLGKTLLGTTDTPRPDIVAEPRPFTHEVDFILREAARYLSRPPTRADVRSAWVGLRPLVRASAPSSAQGGRAAATRSLSREHTVEVGASGLVSVTGGKWTTYRAMAEDVLAACMEQGLLPQRPGGATEHLPMVGAAPGRALCEPPGEHLYGGEAPILRALPGADHWLARDQESGQGLLSEAMVRFAARFEMARSVEDVLARRSRLLFLDAQQAATGADEVAKILAEELGPASAPQGLEAFKALAAQYAAVP